MWRGKVWGGRGLERCGEGRFGVGLGDGREMQEGEKEIQKGEWVSRGGAKQMKNIKN